MQQTNPKNLTTIKSRVFERRFRLIVHAQKKAQNENLLATDEASLVELLGQDVKIVEGNSLNFKVTTQADLKLTESLLKRAEYV